jgi:hypothetical protein
MEAQSHGSTLLRFSETLQVKKLIKLNILKRWRRWHKVHIHAARSTRWATSHAHHLRCVGQLSARSGRSGSPTLRIVGGMLRVMKVLGCLPVSGSAGAARRGWAAALALIEQPADENTQRPRETGGRGPATGRLIWHDSTDRDFTFISRVGTHDVSDGRLVLDVLYCLNGTGGWTQRLLIQTPDGAWRRLRRMHPVRHPAFGRASLTWGQPKTKGTRP